ncbi:hypothetical protein SAMN05444851_2073 [Aliiroseovarius sediminilitoris]|uniref:TadE-like protein n=1 Tax=Aliiroseovarius sediminilitoris TaxID=1173584 RepID=A0A1I0PZ77_9RHOB|nr:hypothetical protein [Aliiroseovarius sediminilitoris]SEW19993.1 hypothetical protein SAMN05444851_2073 [Aliiroseovarius sediminilitoris]
MTNTFLDKMRSAAGRRLSLFARTERGTVTVESVIILPLLLFGLQALHTYFDAYRHQSLALKANYAISDYLSRIDKYDRTILEGLDELFEYMSRSKEESWVRVTVVKCELTSAECNDAIPRKLTLDPGDSQASYNSGITGHTQATMRQYLGPHIPKMYDGEELIVVETVAKYEPPFAGFWTGIYPRNTEHVVVTSPREYQTLCYDTAANPCPVPVTP